MTALPLLLRRAGTALVLDVSGPGLPEVLHWGADPGALAPDELSALRRQFDPGVYHNGPDEPAGLSLLPGESGGWPGRPGLAGHRGGTGVFERFTTTSITVDDEPGEAVQVTIRATDTAIGAELATWIRLEPAGVLRIQHEVTSTGDGEYTVDGLLALLPVPDRAAELLDLTGRWCRERSPQRQPFHQGSRVRESRRGRTGHDATLLLTAGTPGFGFGSGEVWAAHAAWSGNHVHLAERLPGGAGLGGDAVIGAGELLLPGEIRLQAGDSYRTPWVVFVWSDEGLDGASARLHRWRRSLPSHPRSPRPLVLNTWEAVYFNHDLAVLHRLASQAAAIGVERFVLDDGWFAGRRDDKAGLGDWFIDPDVWPGGLGPLADRVRELGMEFGLWVEPEMANPDSDLVRDHPEWLLAAPGRWPSLSRQQVVVDLAHPDAYAYLLERLDDLVKQTGAGFLKWDHNRDLLESVHDGAAGVHEQTLALYRLLDELRARHPGLEIESCASGGGRIDYGILDRTDRVWASDTNDPVERQPIQRWTTSLVPPELIGTHIGPATAHTTGRQSDLSFRCVTALFGHAGIEWDVTACTPDELALLTRWAGLYRELRPLLHSGDVVRADPSGPGDAGTWLHGVVADDQSQAVYAYLRLDTSTAVSGGRIRLPGLDPSRRYVVTVRDECGPAHLVQRRPPAWWADGTVSARGSVLAGPGVAAPLLGPAQGIVLHARVEDLPTTAQRE